MAKALRGPVELRKVLRRFDPGIVHAHDRAATSYVEPVRSTCGMVL